MAEGESRSVVILTAIRIEYDAVRAHLTDLREEKHPVGTVYGRGTFLCTSHPWNVVIVETGAGNTLAAVEAERSINYFKPILILFVGIAGGLKDVKLGDVVAATKVYGYESGKASTTFHSRPDVGKSTYRMEQRARAEARERNWLQRIKGPVPDPLPRVFVEPIAAGDRVVASTRSAIWKFLRTNYSDAVAVEMEGHGFLQAVRANQQVDALIIRGISDLIDGKSEADAAHSKEIAANHASAFAFEILAKLDAIVAPQSGQVAETSVAHEGQQEGESNQHKTTTQEEPETPSSSEIVRHEHLNQFLVGILKYTAKIRKIHDLFNDGKDVFSDRCEGAIKMLDSIDEHVQTLRKYSLTLGIFDRVRLGTIHDQISTLRSELQTFRRLQGLIRTSVQIREYESSRKKICTECETLLTYLDQFKRNY